MDRTRTIKVEMHLVSLKSVVLVVPKDEGEKWQPVKDLIRMECEGLLMQPWGLKSKEMAQEFLQEHSNKWEGTMWRDPEQWMAESWAEVYSFAKEGRGQALRTDKYVDGKFSIQKNPKDGHAITNCVDPSEWKVLEFVVQIPYLEKPNRIAVTVGNTIFGAFSGIRKVS